MGGGGAGDGGERSREAREDGRLGQARAEPRGRQVRGPGGFPFPEGETEAQRGAVRHIDLKLDPLAHRHFKIAIVGEKTLFIILGEKAEYKIYPN